MARYNHFKKPKHKRVKYYELEKGAEFSFSDKPFKKYIKYSNTEYLNCKTNYLTTLHKTTGEPLCFVR